MELGGEETKKLSLSRLLSIFPFLNFSAFARREAALLPEGCGHEAHGGWRGAPRSIPERRVFRAGAGFTMVEVVIMFAIVAIVASIVLVSFPSISGNINVQRTAQRFALSLRQAQSQALAVRVVEGQSGPVVPTAVGVYLTTTLPTTYIFFADMNLNRRYDSGSDIIIESVVMERGVRLIELLDESSGSQSVVNIVFTTPTAEATIYNASGSIGQSARARFQAVSGGLVRSVVARTSGQIAVE